MAKKREETLIENPEKLVLENRKVIVQPILRDRAFFPKKHDGNHTYTGCWRLYCLPISLKTKTYINPFKSKEEQYAFEDLLNLERGDLSTGNRNSKFWGEYNIKIDKEGLVLDLSIVSHALIYRVLSVRQEFAKRGEDINIPVYQYKMVDERYIEETNSKIYEEKQKAYSELFKINDNKKKMIDVLRLLGHRYSYDTSLKILSDKLTEIIEQVNKTPSKNMKNIKDFLKVINDKQATIKLFVFDAMEIGEVQIRQGSYYLTENDELIGQSFQGAVDWFNNPDNNAVKILIEQRLKQK